jgi:hypothetical protein
MINETLQALFDAGFSVYMRNHGDTYAYFTDGQNIGYVQENSMDGVSLSTVHYANKTTGTGFRIANGLDNLRPETLRLAFALAPSWASQIACESVRKYASLAAFLAANSWGGGLKPVDPNSIKTEA